MNNMLFQLQFQITIMVSALNLHLHLDLPRGDYMAWVRIINGFLTEYDIYFMFHLVKINRYNSHLHRSQVTIKF